MDRGKTQSKEETAKNFSNKRKARHDKKAKGEREKLLLQICARKRKEGVFATLKIEIVDKGVPREPVNILKKLTRRAQGKVRPKTDRKALPPQRNKT